MNYATALELPSWTAEIQGYGKTVIRYTPIIFKAFNKTIAPRLLTTFKDLSHYYYQCGKGAGEWAMTAAGITHNPIQSAVRSAHAELTSAEAQATYSRIRHITRETAMDAIVVGLCGVVAVATTIETAQAIYRHVVAFYGIAQAWFNPAPVIVPTVEIGVAVTSDEAIAAIVEEVRYERYFLEQFDQLDSDILAINAEEIDEAIAQVTITQLKSSRAVLALKTEGERLAREALAYVIDQAVRFAAVKQQAVAEVAVVDDMAASLQVPGATGAPRRQRKASTRAEAAAAKPKQTRARAKAGAKAK
jgi:hypothetical protein